MGRRQEPEWQIAARAGWSKSIIWRRSATRHVRLGVDSTCRQLSNSAGNIEAIVQTNDDLGTKRQMETKKMTAASGVEPNVGCHSLAAGCLTGFAGPSWRKTP